MITAESPPMESLEDVAALMEQELERLQLSLEMWRLSAPSERQRQAIKGLVRSIDEREEALIDLRRMLRTTG